MTAQEGASPRGDGVTVPAATREAVPAPAGDRTALTLETEPVVFFHPLGAGAAVPGPVQPAGGPPLLEEEPTVWPEPAPRPDPRGG